MDSDSQFHNNNKTTDPWFSTDNVIISENQTNKFEDNFNSTFFEKLPDSNEYLALLGKFYLNKYLTVLKTFIMQREN